MFFRKLPDTVAAIDLGSNSFHMIVAKIENGQIHVVDKIKGVPTGTRGPYQNVPVEPVEIRSIRRAADE